MRTAAGAGTGTPAAPDVAEDVRGAVVEDAAPDEAVEPEPVTASPAGATTGAAAGEGAGAAGAGVGVGALAPGAGVPPGDGATTGTGAAAGAGSGTGAGVDGGAEAIGRGGSSVAGSTYPSAAEETRMPRWTYGTGHSAPSFAPATPTESPSETSAPFDTVISPRCVSETA